MKWLNALLKFLGLKKESADEYYIEIISFCGKDQIQSFIGPFKSEEDRDKYQDVISKEESDCYENARGLSSIGEIEAWIASSINPNHFKHIPYNGPLPKGKWEKFKRPDDKDDDIFEWIKWEEIIKMSKASRGPH